MNFYFKTAHLILISFHECETKPWQTPPLKHIQQQEPMQNKNIETLNIFLGGYAPLGSIHKNVWTDSPALLVPVHKFNVGSTP